MSVRVLLLSSLVLAACGQVDPCAKVAGACLTLRVTSASALVVDELDVDASGAFTGTEISTHAGGVALPIRLGVVPSPGAMPGTLTLAVTGKSGGVVRGTGIVTHPLTDKDRSTIEVVLTSGGEADLGGDAAGADLAENLDLAGFSCTPMAPIDCGMAGAVLHVCNATGDGIDSQVCAFSCDSIPSPHCKVFVPSAPVTQAMIDASPSTDITLTGTIKLNTDDGSIDGFRPSNSVPGTAEAKNGIIFQQIGGAGVFTLHSLLLDEAAVVNVVGTRSLVIVAPTTITIHGVLDARPHDAAGALCQLSGSTACPTAGGGLGGAGGSTNVKAGGAGGGSSPNNADGNDGGGGGGGNGEAARIGGTGSQAGAAQTGGAGGAETLIVFPLVGGGGGGGGSTSQNPGGSGGGAVHLVAGVRVQIGGGSNATPMGINVSGCGGKGGIMSGSPSGGGAGGNIVIESPLVDIAANGALVSNGGGGGGDNSGNGGVSGLSLTAATGGAGDTTYAMGGQGGANSFAPGNGGSNATQSTQSGGGSGGAVGHILLRNLSGSLSPAGSSIISPMMGLKSMAMNPITSVGTITLQ